MAAAQHKLSRRALLVGACAVPVLPLPRHPELDPGSTFLPAVEKERWIPDEVRHDEVQDARVEEWRKALARYRRAEAGLEAVAHTKDDELYDRALGRHHAVLARLLRTPAPDVAGVSRKLDLIVRHSAFELSLAEPCLVWLRQDLGRLTGTPPPP
jgi:hypothetical protein